MRLARNTGILTLKQHPLTQNNLPAVTYWLLCLTCILCLVANNDGFHRAKNVQMQMTRVCF